MPQPQISEEAARRLVALYEAAERRLAARLGEALGGPEGRAAARLRSLLRQVDQELDRLDAASRAWIESDLLAVFAGGAQAASTESAGAFTQMHREAVQNLATRTYRDVLQRTRFVRRDSKRTLRKLARSQALRAVLGEQTAQGAGRTLAEVAVRETGLFTVRYANGARHSIADWADTNARTVTALAYNEGTFTQAEFEGVRFFEAFDGPGCGLERHGVPPFANGLVVPAEVARANPIAHPRCARSWTPRPDITSKKAARSATSDRRQAAREAAQDAALAETRLVGGQAPGFFSVGRQQALSAGRQARRTRAARTARSARTARR